LQALEAPLRPIFGHRFEAKIEFLKFATTISIFIRQWDGEVPGIVGELDGRFTAISLMILTLGMEFSLVLDVIAESLERGVGEFDKDELFVIGRISEA